LERNDVFNRIVDEIIEWSEASVLSLNKNVGSRSDSRSCVKDVARTISVDDSHTFVCNSDRCKASITLASVPDELV